MEKRTKILLLPVGSYEQHGTFLPLETDIKIAEYMAERLANEIEECCVLPVIPFGMADEHNGFSGTISVSMQSAVAYWMDILQSISRNQKNIELVIIINGHGGNQSTLEAVCSQMNYNNSGPRFVSLHVFQPQARELAAQLFGAFSAHADSVETSVYAVIDSSMEDGVYLDSDIQISKSQALTLFPTKMIADNGIITKKDKIVVQKEWGKKVIEESIREMKEQCEKYMELILQMHLK